MKISATSALVLNWSAPNLWQTTQALDYLNNLDMSKGKELIDQFDETANYWHTQVVSGRKFWMKKATLEFLKHYPQAQIIILGAGIAPLSIEIGSLYPSCKIFDVDQYAMAEKEALVNKNPNNIKFIECDVSNITLLQKKLNDAGFNPHVPSMIIMEGIVYYISSDSLLSILKHFRQFDPVITCDFSVFSEKVNEKTRGYLTDVRKKIINYANLSFFTCYDENEMAQLFKMAGFQNVRLINTRQIQKERTGSEEPFTANDISWNRVILASS